MKTPSIGIDQNEEGRFIDKYWGRLPMYLHRIPETANMGRKHIVECNPEYMKLVTAYLNGTINKDNLSYELYNEIEDVIDAMPNYGLVPNPDYDDLYDCLGYPAALNGCPTLLVKTGSNRCAVFMTADGCYFTVKP